MPVACDLIPALLLKEKGGACDAVPVRPSLAFRRGIEGEAATNVRDLVTSGNARQGSGALLLKDWSILACEA
jgi:hypothetical protein